MKKYYFRVTKYNPKNRDELGNYILKEWTSISDIGKLVTLENYIIIENSYIDYIINLLDKFNYNTINYIGLQSNNEVKYITENDKKFILSLYKGDFITKNDVKEFVKLSLREVLGGVLYTNKIEVFFGYDYYMYIITSDEKIYEYLKNSKINYLYIEEINGESIKYDNDWKEFYGYTEKHFL